MTRYFFDYRLKNEAICDYGGNEFASAQGALEFAAEIAENLRNSLAGHWVGWSVEVRNAEGRKFFSLEVRDGSVAA